MSSNTSGASTKSTAQSGTRAQKAGLNFPVGRIHRMLKANKFANRIGVGAPVYMAAVLEYISAEILELSGSCALENKRERITPSDVQQAVRNDLELNKLLSNVVIGPRTGPLPSLPSLPIQTTKDSNPQ